MFTSGPIFDMWTLVSRNISQPLSTMTDFGYQTWQPVQNQYNYWMSLGDPRVKDWLLMRTPWPTLGLTLFYLYVCMKGPKQLMSNRKPYEVKSLILLYNLSVTLLNLYVGLELLYVSTQLKFSWTCQPVDYSNDPLALRIASALWWYYFSKLVEMLDSVFFILRKKESQLTFLHVYHHSTMFCLWWIGVKYVAGGSSFLGAMFNCFVHVLMYSYYFISALGPEFKKWLWWKRYLTIIQMAQFVFAMVMGINAIIVGCEFPLWMQYAMVLYMVSFLVLFSKYFYNEYLLSKVKGKKKNR